MGFEESKTATVAIYSQSGAIVGMGFLVSENYVLTCAHVVNAACKNKAHDDSKVISITFPFISRGQEYDTNIVGHWLEETERQDKDYAILKLQNKPPSQVEPICLKTVQNYGENGSLQVFGIPKGDEKGRNLIAVVRGGVIGGWTQIEDTKNTGIAVEERFSGAPVWWSRKNADGSCEEVCIGMIVARDRKREEAKIGFMISTAELRMPLRKVTKLELEDILKPHELNLSTAIATAYKICRPEDLRTSLPDSLEGILEDLLQRSHGESNDSKLEQFVACLLNQQSTNDVEFKLRKWAELRTDSLDQLCEEMWAKQKQLLSESADVNSNINLFIEIQPDKDNPKQYHERVCLISNNELYHYETGTGAIQLTRKQINYQADDIEESITANKLRQLLGKYLTCIGGTYKIPLDEINIHFFIPINLLNECYEQWEIPDEFGFPLSLCKQCHIVVRSQERLENYRYRGDWETKWRKLNQFKHSHAHPLFISEKEAINRFRTDIKSLESIFGFKFSKVPSTERGGGLAFLLRTAMPLALWLRKELHSINNEATDCETIIENGIFGCCPDNPNGCCLGELPESVAEVRKSAPELEEKERQNSHNIGHHLSFLWEDPNLVPPTVFYSTE